jgi:hypothetical protein
MHFLPLSSLFLVNYHKISAPKNKKEFCCIFPFSGENICNFLEKTTFGGEKNNGHISTQF